MEHSYRLTTTQLNIRETFDIRQIVVKNPTAFPVYINISSAIPTRDRFDYLVQSHSTFVSPMMQTKFITVSVVNTNLPVTDVEIIVSDTIQLEAANIPQVTAQFVSSFPGYPFTLNGITGGTISLPSINLDKFQTIFFTMKEWGDSSWPIAFIDDSTNGIPFGGFNQNGGVVSYTPKQIPTTLFPRLFFQSSDGFTRTVNNSNINVFTSSDYIEQQFNPPPSGALLNIDTPYPWGLIHYIHQPGYILSVLATDTTQFGSVVLNLTMQAIIREANQIDVELFNRTFTNTVTPPYKYLINPRLRMVGSNAALKINLTNNTPANGCIVRVYFNTFD